ncbi:18404_t:CDS:1, partial [Acaulospora morrowiae]
KYKYKEHTAYERCDHRTLLWSFRRRIHAAYVSEMAACRLIRTLKDYLPQQNGTLMIVQIVCNRKGSSKTYGCKNSCSNTSAVRVQETSNDDSK